MKRAYYSNSIYEFLKESPSSILGELTANHSNRTLEELQVNAWKKQISILKNQLETITGQIYFEFAIPRMGKRVDNIIIIEGVIFVLEFKVGDCGYEKHAIEQVVDYTLDLKSFHEGSHNAKLIPVLVASNGIEANNKLESVVIHKTAVKANQHNLVVLLKTFLNENDKIVDIDYWQNSIYKPTPTIVEAAQALYKGHNVKDITRNDSDKVNLAITSNCLNSIIEYSKKLNKKTICFLTGVPGAGKTLAGLTIAVDRMNVDEDEQAVFLSGNGPLVEVLREALTRDGVKTALENGYKITKKQSAIKANAFIQNIHHFRDDNLLSINAPVEKVVVFDEAQRAWNTKQVSSFMKRKKGIENFNMSEPEFLIDVMNRHTDWCTIVCLIGGGQEINTGEAGLEEWISSLKNHFPDWKIHYSNSILNNNNYLKPISLNNWLLENGQSENELHLSVSVRSFRSEKLSDFIHELLDLNFEEAKSIFSEIENLYPIVVTRNLEKAKHWLKKKAVGTHRIGLISSSGARRLKSNGIDVKNEISASNWFLNSSEDVRFHIFLKRWLQNLTFKVLKSIGLVLLGEAIFIKLKMHGSIKVLKELNGKISTKMLIKNI